MSIAHDFALAFLSLLLVGGIVFLFLAYDNYKEKKRETKNMMPEDRVYLNRTGYAIKHNLFLTEEETARLVENSNHEETALEMLIELCKEKGMTEKEFGKILVLASVYLTDNNR